MTVDSGQGAEGMGENTLFLSMTPKLRQIMLMLKMTYAYLENNNGELHLEPLLACLLCVMKSGMKKMNTSNLDVPNEDWGEHETNTEDAAWDRTTTANDVWLSYFSRTAQEGKSRPNGDVFPSEKQMIKTFLANLHRCEGMHSKGSESNLRDVWWGSGKPV